MRYANIKKKSLDEQQNQTTTTTNINYIKNFKKTKVNNNVKIASDKTEIKEKNL